MVNKPMILILNFEPPTMKCILLSLLCSLLIIAVPADAADLIIVNGGQPGAEIVIGKKRPRMATPAALEQSKAGAEWVNFTEGKTDGVWGVPFASGFKGFWKSPPPDTFRAAVPIKFSRT